MIARAARAVVAWLAAHASIVPGPPAQGTNHEEAAIFARFRSARIEFQRPVRLVVQRAPKRLAAPPLSDAVPAPEAAPPAPDATPAAATEPPAPTWHLRKSDAGWVVEQEGEPEPVAVLRTRRQALQEADALARSARGRLIIHQANGTVERDHRLD